MAGQQCLCVYHTCNRKRACAVSIQWLRGYRADIGAEFSLMADTLGRMETLAVAGGQSIFDTLVHRWGGTGVGRDSFQQLTRVIGSSEFMT